MSYPAQFLALDRQPSQTDVRLLAGTFVKETLVERAGTALPQHAHSFAHVSVIVRGAVRLYRDKQLAGEYHAPCAVLIPARCMHLFVTLADNTVILCVHDGEADVAEEHHLDMSGG